MTIKNITFKLSPIAELFYNEDTLYGIYKIQTSENIPYSSEIGVFDSDDKMFSSIITGKMQRLTIGLEYNCEAKENYNKKYKQWQYEVIKILPQKPNSLDEQSKFLKCIITENQANTLLNTYPGIIEMIMNNKEVDLTKTKGIKEATYNKIKEK